MKVFKSVSMLVLTALIVGFAPALQAAYAEGTSQLTVSSQLEDGGQLEGMFTELVFGSQTIATSFTPSTYTLNNDEEYSIGVADFEIYFFTYWLDTGSPDRWRTITITEDTALVAVYVVDDGEAEETQTNSDNTRSSNRGYLLSLVERLEVYEGDTSKVPNINLSGYVLPSGSYISEYAGLYDLIDSDVDVPSVMKAVQWSGLDWNGLSEAQQCYLSLVLTSGIQLDENGLPATLTT